MENLNAEQVKKALECCVTQGAACRDCPIKYDSRGARCYAYLKQDALSLIKSYEEQIFALENRLKECENGYEGTLALEREKVKELTEENERLQDLVKEVQEYNENWVKDNGRLLGILLQFTDIVHKWGNKNGYDVSEISLVPILNEESAIKKQIKADTVKEMQKRLKERSITKWDYEEAVSFDTIDQIAKEIADE